MAFAMGRDGGLLERLTGFSVRHRVMVALAWLLATMAFGALVPSLEQVAAKDATAILPDSAPSFRAMTAMDKDFGAGGAKSVAFIVLVDDGGLTNADRAYYADLVAELRRDTKNVAGVQDIVSRPELTDALQSKDGRALYIPVGLTSATGSPESTREIEHLRDLLQKDRPARLDAYVTGAGATIADLQTAMDLDVQKITIVTVVFIAGLLLLIYRSVPTGLVALLTIGVSLGVARGLAALLGQSFLPVSTYTAAFLTAVVLGAGTDYSIFIISRFQELRRNGEQSLPAVAAGAGRVGHVIVAAAATVVVASAAMAFAQLAPLRTAGPAIALGVIVTCLASLTLTPALLGLAVNRGWAQPRPSPRTTGLWTRVGALVARRPVRVLVLGLVVLGALAAFYPSMRPGFDERDAQPASSESNRGYQALADHFAANEVLPDYLLITAGHDMRNPRDLAALEQVAAAVAAVEGVHSVRGVTRPLGTPIAEASLAYQAGEVGKRLGEAEDRLAAGRGDTDKLADGAGRLADGAADLSTGARAALDGANKLLAGLEAGEEGMGEARDGTAEARDGSRRLAAGARELAAGLRLAHDQTAMAVDGLGLAYNALRASAGCNLDPACARARDGVGEIYRSERNQLLPGLAEAARGAQRIAEGNGDLADGLGELRAGLGRAWDGISRLADGQRRLKTGLGELAGGAGEVADGAAKVGDGTDQLAGATKELQAGLARAADLLQRAGSEARDPAVGGFYLPAGALDDPRMALARGYYLSPDGRTARLLVLGESDPFDGPAMQRFDAERRAAEEATRGGPLEGAELMATGIPAVHADLDNQMGEDFRLVALGVLFCVLLVLIVLLRSLVAPIYLLASVLLSYVSAIGLATLVWQHGLGHDIEWNVPIIAFVILVAVGADYNIFLISRVREDAPDGSRWGIARAVAATGGVITTAGVIFAGSFLAFMAADVGTLKQIGFTIGLGLLLDTFVVRTLIVPSIAALLGRRNWWPAREDRATYDSDLAVPAETR